MNPTRHPYLDSLRGWAILLVVLTHAALGRSAIDGLVTTRPGPVLGVPAAISIFCGAAVFGVPLFFVISAVSQFLSWRTREISGAAGLRDYFIRRFFRVAPIFYVAIVFYLWLFGWGPRAFAPYGIDWSDVLATIAFVHGWKWNAINSVVPGAWSISAIVMFYVVFPAVMTIARSRLLLALVTLLAIGFSQALELHAQAHHAVHGPLGWFGFPAEAVVFLFGVWAAQSIWALRDSVAGSAWPYGRGASAVLFLALIVVLPFLHLPVRLLAYRIQFAALASILCVSLHFYPAPIVVSRLMAAIGRRSYSMFVFHFALLGPVFVVASRIASRLFGVDRDLGILAVYFPLLLLSSLLVGAILYAIVERPFIAMGQRLIDRLHARALGDAFASV